MVWRKGALAQGKKAMIKRKWEEGTVTLTTTHKREFQEILSVCPTVSKECIFIKYKYAHTKQKERMENFIGRTCFKSPGVKE